MIFRIGTFRMWLSFGGGCFSLGGVLTTGGVGYRFYSGRSRVGVNFRW
jgi:hypothetical protein